MIKYDIFMGIIKIPDEKTCPRARVCVCIHQGTGFCCRRSASPMEHRSKVGSALGSEKNDAKLVVMVRWKSNQTGPAQAVAVALHRRRRRQQKQQAKDANTQRMQRMHPTPAGPGTANNYISPGNRTDAAHGRRTSEANLQTEAHRTNPFRMQFMMSARYYANRLIKACRAKLTW